MKKLDFEVMSSVEGGTNCDRLKVAALCMTIASLAIGATLPAFAGALMFGPTEIAFAVAGLSC